MAFLEGKHTLVTGGSRGIGRAIVNALHREGATVFLAARDPLAAREAARALGGRAHGIACREAMGIVENQ